MLSWFDLSFLLVVLGGLLGGVGAAREAQAGLGMGLLVALAGLLFGYGMAIVSRIVSGFILTAAAKISEKSRGGRLLRGCVAFGIYFFSPFFFILATDGLPIWIATLFHGS